LSSPALSIFRIFYFSAIVNSLHHWTFLKEDDIIRIFVLLWKHFPSFAQMHQNTGLCKWRKIPDRKGEKKERIFI